MRILQGIASGLLGPQAFKEGIQTALLGGALHILIALSAAAVFYAASRKIRFMTRRPILHPAQTITRSIIAIVTHMVCVGLPISLMVRRYSAPR